MKISAKNNSMQNMNIYFLFVHFPQAQGFAVKQGRPIEHQASNNNTRLTDLCPGLPG